MSIVDDQIRRLDAALDRIQLAAAERTTETTEESQVIGDGTPIVAASTDSTYRARLKSVRGST